MTRVLQIEPQLRERLLGFPPPVRIALLNILRMPTWERADVIGKLYGSGQARQLSELLMDLEDDRYTRTVVMGILAEMENERRRNR
jgi:hypothetical protein